jgi:hypothetical protein
MRTDLETFHLKTVLRVLALNAKQRDHHNAPDQPLTMLTYAAMGLHYPGRAPQTTHELAHCAVVLKEFPWMRPRAFEYLSGLTGSAWPYIVAKWDKLLDLLDAETGCSEDPLAYAPHTHQLLQECITRRCGKVSCGHAPEDHTWTQAGYCGPCSIAGCKCGFYLTPQVPDAPHSPARCSTRRTTYRHVVPRTPRCNGGDVHA